MILSIAQYLATFVCIYLVALIAAVVCGCFLGLITLLLLPEPNDFPRARIHRGRR